MLSLLISAVLMAAPMCAETQTCFPKEYAEIAPEEFHMTERRKRKPAKGARKFLPKYGEHAGRIERQKQ